MRPVLSRSVLAASALAGRCPAAWSRKPLPAEGSHALHHLFGKGREFVTVELLIPVFVEPHGSVEESLGGGLTAERAAEATRPAGLAVAWATLPAFTVAIRAAATRAEGTFPCRLTVAWAAAEGAFAIWPIATWSKRAGALAAASWKPLSTLHAGEALAGPAARWAEAGAERAWHGRTEFLAAERAVAVFVEGQQRRSRRGDLICVEPAVAVAVEGLEKRIAGRAERPARTAAGASFPWAALAWPAAEALAVGPAFTFAFAVSAAFPRRVVAFRGLGTCWCGKHEQAGCKRGCGAEAGREERTDRERVHGSISCDAKRNARHGLCSRIASEPPNKS